MTTSGSDRKTPKVFISYSWDDTEHREWVKQLAIRLRRDYVDVTLDRWHVRPGDQLTEFMERSVRESDFVIAVCTPRFKERSNTRGGGVGYEGNIITAGLFRDESTRKIIPVLRSGTWSEAAPTWLFGLFQIDLSGDPYAESEYQDLKQTLLGEWETAPPLGDSGIEAVPWRPAGRPPEPETPTAVSRPRERPRHVLGIDLGTTNTLCACWVEGTSRPEIELIEQPIYEETRLIGKETLPSAVFVRPSGEALVGLFARNSAQVGVDNLVISVKRHMGTGWVRPIAGRDWTPEEISGCILSAVRTGIRRVSEDPPEWVVITVPASFGTEQRRATLAAAQLAGFDPERTRLFDEPAAALLHQTRQEAESKDSETERRLMVLDIGGGTLDVSCLGVQTVGGVLHANILGRSRYNELAGDDFDLNLAGLLLGRFEDERQLSIDSFDPADRRQICYALLQSAEQIKIQILGQNVEVPKEARKTIKGTANPLLPNAMTWDAQANLDDLYAAVKEFFVYRDDPEYLEGRFTLYQAILQCEESVRQSGSPDPDRAPDLFFLAGGSSGLPAIRAAVRRIYEARKGLKNIPVIPVNRPMQAIALGAAWYAGSLAGFPDARMEVTERMYDGIYLQTRRSTFKELVSPQAVLPVAEHDIATEFRSGGPGHRVPLDLFLGAAENDARMHPLDRRSLVFDNFVPSDSAIVVSVGVTADRELKLRARTTVDNKPVRGEVQVETLAGWKSESSLGRPLPTVNGRSPGVLR